MTRRNTIVALAAAAIALLGAPKPRAQARAPLGTNLARIDDWSPEYALADVVHLRPA